jgi:hypothetical protein
MPRDAEAVVTELCARVCDHNESFSQSDMLPR